MDVFALSVKIKEEGAATVKASTDKLRDSLKGVGTEANKAGLASKAGFSMMEKAAAAAAASLALAVGFGLKKLIDATSTAQFGQAQLASAIRSTGGQAGQSIGALNAHAAALQKITNFGDETINTAQALLLTFTQIQGNTFPKATEAVLNVAAAMGTDLKSAAIQVGKALNDPILGVTALARSGIQFTEAQKAMIKTLVESGQIVQAQTIILKELETQFGGSAAAARDTLGGALASLKNAFGDLFEVSREGAAPAIAAIEGLTKAVQGIGNAIKIATPIAILFFGLFAATKMNLIVSTLGALVNTVLALVPALLSATAAQIKLNLAMAANPVGLLVAGLSAATAGLLLFANAQADAAEAQDDETKNSVKHQAALFLSKQRRDAQAAALRNVTTSSAQLREQLAALATREAGLQTQLEQSNGSLVQKAIVTRALISVQSQMATVQGVLTERTKKESAAQAELRDQLLATAAIHRKVEIDLFNRRRQRVGGSTEVIESLRTDGSVAAGRVTSAATIKLPDPKPLFDAATLQAAQIEGQLRDTFENAIGNSIGDGIAAGFERGFASGSIGEGFKALAGTMLSGLGSAMITFGLAGKGFAALIAKFKAAAASLNAGATIGASLALIAGGAALKGVASAAFGGMGGGGGMAVTPTTQFGIPMSGGGGTTQLLFGATSATTAAGMTPRSAMNVTIIGPDDPKAQRAIQELISKGASRGHLG